MDVTVYLSLVDQEHLSLEISETVAFWDPLVVFSSSATLLQGILRGPPAARDRGAKVGRPAKLSLAKFFRRPYHSGDQSFRALENPYRPP
jgi:hypothetical protein